MRVTSKISVKTVTKSKHKMQCALCFSAKTNLVEKVDSFTKYVLFLHYLVKETFVLTLKLCTVFDI